MINRHPTQQAEFMEAAGIDYRWKQKPDMQMEFEDAGINTDRRKQERQSNRTKSF